jgi:hypothetical protein
MAHALNKNHPTRHSGKNQNPKKPKHLTWRFRQRIEQPKEPRPLRWRSYHTDQNPQLPPQQTPIKPKTKKRDTINLQSF